MLWALAKFHSSFHWYQKSTSSPLFDVTMAIYWRRGHKKPDFRWKYAISKFSPKILGKCDFDGVFCLLLDKMTIITYTGSFKCIAPVFLDYEQKQKSGSSNILLKWPQRMIPLSCSHLVAETSVLAAWKISSRGVVTTPFGRRALIKICHRCLF